MKTLFKKHSSTSTLPSKNASSSPMLSNAAAQGQIFFPSPPRTLTVYDKLRVAIHLVQPDGLVQLQVRLDRTGIVLLVDPLHGEILQKKTPPRKANKSTICQSPNSFVRWNRPAPGRTGKSRESPGTARRTWWPRRCRWSSPRHCRRFSP